MSVARATEVKPKIHSPQRRGGRRVCAEDLDFDSADLCVTPFLCGEGFLAIDASLISPGAQEQPL